MSRTSSSAGTSVPVLSVFDRLCVEDGRRDDVAAMREAVRRDLQNMLNTRVRCRPIPAFLGRSPGRGAAGSGGLDCSLANYGLPDVTGADLGSPQQRDEFRREVERAIRRFFDRRLDRVRVRHLDGHASRDSQPARDRTLRLRIDAMLRIRPAPQPVEFDTAIEPATARFCVKPTAGGNMG